MAKEICSVFLTEGTAWVGLFSKGNRGYRLEDLQSMNTQELERFLTKRSLSPVASFYTRNTLWGVGDFLPGKETLLELQVRKAVTDTGMLQGPFVLRYRILDKTSDFYRIAYVAVPTQTQQLFLNFLNPKKVIVKGLFPAEASLTALISPLGPENTGIIIPSPEGYYLIFSQNGSVLYTRSITIYQGTNEKEQLSDSLQETLSFLKHNYSFLPQTIYSLVPSITEDLLPPQESITITPFPLEKILGSVLSGDPAPVAILLGNLMVPPQFNLLDASYLAETQARQWNKIIQYGVLALASFLFSIAMWEGKDVLLLRQEYMQKYETLQKEVAQMIQVNPNSEEIQQVKRFLEIYQAYKDQPKLDHLLLWLSLHLPPRATITSMEASPLVLERNSPQPSPQEPPLSSSTPETFPHIRSLKVVMEGHITGEYLDVRSAFYNFVSNLENIANVTNSQFSYGGKEGVFHIEITYTKRGETP